MNRTLAVLTLVTMYLIMGCTKNSSTIGSTPVPASQSHVGRYGMYGHSNARYSGSGYSQSIPVDTANNMIQSYLFSVNYPTTDTALRSLTFDADTLRAYLKNSNIVTLKFMLAHQPDFVSTHGSGVYSGYDPNALTMVVVGLNDNDDYVLNSRNEVYEHFSPCPIYCTTNLSPTIQ